MGCSQLLEMVSEVAAPGFLHAQHRPTFLTCPGRNLLCAKAHPDMGVSGGVKWCRRLEAQHPWGVFMPVAPLGAFMVWLVLCRDLGPKAELLIHL